MDKERQLKREKQEQYREMMAILVQLREEAAQLAHVISRGQGMVGNGDNARR